MRTSFRRFWQTVARRATAGSQPASNNARQRRLPAVELLEDRCMLSSQSVFAVGADAGGQPTVKLFDALTGAQKLSFSAYANSFHGGVRVALGDFTGDGVLDIVTGPGPGGGAQVRVFNGLTGKALSGTLGNFNAYAPGQTDGVYVAAGDVNGDGRADIITGTNDGAAPVVKVFNGLNGALLASFSVGAADSTTGVRVAAHDVTGELVRGTPLCQRRN